MAEIVNEKFRIVGGQNLSLEEDETFGITYWKNVKRKLIGNKTVIVAAIILLLIAAVILLGPELYKYGINEPNKNIKNLKPTLEHPFGADFEGKDLFVRVCRGAQTTLLIGLVGAALNTAIGTVCGAISGYFGGLIDNIFMRVIEILLSIPTFILAIIISILYKPGVLALIVAMCINGWCNMARIVRGQVIQICNQEFILAAQALGSEPARIISKHIIGNLTSIIVVAATLEIPLVMLNEAFLTFIRCGIRAPQISLGLVSVIGYDNFIFYPFQTIIPGLFMTLILLCFNIIGDGLRDALEPSIN